MPSAVPYSFSQIHTHDVQEQAAGLSSWDQHHEQLSNGVFEGCLETLEVNGIQVFHEWANQTTFQTGAAQYGSLGMAVTASTQDGWYCGHRLQGVQLIGTGFEGEFELVAGAHMHLLSVVAPAQRLQQLAQALEGEAFDASQLQPTLLDPLQVDQQSFRQILDYALELGRSHADALAQPAVQRMLSLALFEAMLQGFHTCHYRPLPPTAAARQHIVNQARAYMSDHADEVITVPDLCVATGVSRRALQYAFNEVLQLSPVTYLRVMRLNQVHRELQSPHADSVGDVAARWGFWHLSRFAAEYRQLFGELPSATRARGAMRTIQVTACGPCASQSPVWSHRAPQSH